MCRDLEQYVESVRRDSSTAKNVRAITLKEVEEGAVGLRKVGESLAALKGKRLYFQKICMIHYCYKEILVVCHVKYASAFSESRCTF